ncbi:unnamed protein product [Protopolystoma xenopodis]|uniref:Uncharacterized protein n=1 Tax=Protopolystoma xenopodis TaxID=117903 RepID=A0A3S5CDI1_9PLAT|nr:unnamed protein product [Protopolystoma xenopodis]
MKSTLLTASPRTARSSSAYCLPQYSRRGNHKRPSSGLVVARRGDTPDPAATQPHSRQTARPSGLLPRPVGLRMPGSATVVRIGDRPSDRPGRATAPKRRRTQRQKNCPASAE